MSKKSRDFNPHASMATIGEGRKFVLFPKKQTIFAQGDPSDAVFYVQTGKVKLTVVSRTGKEATIGILSPGDFFGEACLTGQPLRMRNLPAGSTATEPGWVPAAKGDDAMRVRAPEVESMVNPERLSESRLAV